jgi:hypothetical protein
LSAATSLCSAALQVDVRVPPRDPIIGKPFPLKVTVSWQGDAADYLLLPIELPEREGFTFLDYSMSSSKIGEENCVEYAVFLIVDNEGKTDLGRIAVPYRIADSEEEQTLQSDPVAINVRRNPLPMQIVMGAISAAAVVLLVVLSRRVAESRREERERHMRFEKVDRTLELIEKLEELKSLRLAGDVGAYLVGLTEVAAQCGVSVGESGAYEELKTLAERTKFDGYHPSVEELDSSYRTVERWIKRGADRPAGEVETASATED